MLLSEIYGIVSVERPLWREDRTAICSAFTQWSKSRRTHDHILLSRLRLSQPGGPGSRIYIPQEQRVPVILLATGFPLRRLIRLIGLRLRYSNPPPLMFRQMLWFIATLLVPRRKHCKLVSHARNGWYSVTRCFISPRTLPIESFVHDAPWYVPNAVIPRDLQTPTAKEEIHRYSSPQATPKRPSSEPHGATRQQWAFAKAPAKWSAYHIPSVIVVFVVLVCKSHSQKLQEALNPEERYWALFYMPLYTFLHNLLNVPVQTANGIGLQKLFYFV
jgi:hypothetical protein